MGAATEQREAPVDTWLYKGWLAEFRHDPLIDGRDWLIVLKKGRETVGLDERERSLPDAMLAAMHWIDEREG